MRQIHNRIDIFHINCCLPITDSFFFVSLCENTVPKTPVFATAVRSFAAKPHVPSGDVVIPELADTLEWVLDSPPTVHQFDEPPVSFSPLKSFDIYQMFIIIVSPLVQVRWGLQYINMSEKSIIST